MFDPVAYLKKNIDETIVKHDAYNKLNGLYVEPHRTYKPIDIDVIQTHKALNLFYSENKDAFMDINRTPKHGAGAPETFVFLI
jgi:hypothetical protein